MITKFGTLLSSGACPLVGLVDQLIASAALKVRKDLRGQDLRIILVSGIETVFGV